MKKQTKQQAYNQKMIGHPDEEKTLVKIPKTGLPTGGLTFVDISGKPIKEQTK